MIGFISTHGAANGMYGGAAFSLQFGAWLQIASVHKPTVNISTDIVWSHTLTNQQTDAWAYLLGALKVGPPPEEPGGVTSCSSWLLLSCTSGPPWWGAPGGT